MKMVICSIYDKATEAYMRPFTAQTLGQATRMFLDEVNKEGNPINAHPEDYALFHIADFTDNDGLIKSIEVKCLARAHEHQEKPQERIEPITPLIGKKKSGTNY